jgi:hypothetical protein
MVKTNLLVLIMSKDNRRHVRFNPKGLKATITIYQPLVDEDIHLQGSIIDLSYSGIRIKLLSAIPADLPESKIKIAVTMPKSGISITIKGSIRHFNEEAEYGVHYSEDHNEHTVDDFMFECIKTTEHHPPVF